MFSSNASLYLGYDTTVQSKMTVCKIIRYSYDSFLFKFSPKILVLTNAALPMNMIVYVALN